ncbi:RNA polymerase sigma factor [Flavobacterium humi]|uniref:RNA polymerase sigma factor n=1 Tax=Flavobacterium humi TaxID=2562683 RepID=A0A4Z0LC81_9FLAO|nr:RNA polymerase sigma factor [Flavobacterium humi]TGD59484.1 RNA polymerase sigma factor [Flavobacterium humi]
MDNPFTLHYPDHTDTALVASAIKGDKKALQNLILRHQVFIYNLALKMSKNVEDAEDLTQEVFIKAITALGKFEGKSSFRTWLYRITVNHFLNSRKRKTELQVFDFETYFDSIDTVPNHPLNETEEHELTDSIEELRISCTAGMLLCLNREQRLVYILGEMFEIDHNLGGEILGISPGNFRIKLMRARTDLYNWMNKRCGLVNAGNACRCSKKTRAYINAGLVDPDNLKFNARYKEKIYDLSGQKATEITETIEDLNKKIYQSHPLQQPLTISKIVDEICNNSLIKSILDL